MKRATSELHTHSDSHRPPSATTGVTVTRATTGAAARAQPSILQQIVTRREADVAAAKAEVPLADLHARAAALDAELGGRVRASRAAHPDRELSSPLARRS